jgi:hypothetical protein
MSRMNPGDFIIHKCPDGGTVEMEHGEVRIIGSDGIEVVSWNADEWQEDVDAVTATLNAVSLALKYGVNAVQDLLQ